MPTRRIVNAWVKQGILLGFRLGQLEESGDALTFVDKNTFPARHFSLADRVRVVPGGSSAREGAYIVPSSTYAPTLINIGGMHTTEGAM